MFNKVKQFRRIATRYDKTKVSFAALLNLAVMRLWLRDFANRAQTASAFKCHIKNIL